jgi:tetratricopeptide (TPR) repeat protein
MAELARLPRLSRHAPFRARRSAKQQQRYMAFLSYSHNDEETAAWLHESLEDFRVPPRLVGQLTDFGAVPKRLTPIFRDRHELAASGDLGEEIEEAIAGSRFLIVLCSPTAAQSHWINEEIICFKRLQSEDRILAVVIEGEPFASDEPGREAEECFPPALRTHYDGRGRPTGQRAEPLAADLRPTGDGRRMGLLKVAAGLLGVGLDDLAQREAHRRQRRLYAITAASLVGMLFTSGLAYTAVTARDEARDQRREAEGLIGFMLGDLREKLEPIGRLDVLDSVGARALAYYEKQNKTDLSDAALAQRSRALTLMGEMANTRGDLEGALRRYREAMAGTSEALRRNPNDPQRLFDHAQNVFWVGYIDYQRGNLDKAASAFRNYRSLADRMIALRPGDPKYRLERISADSVLGTVLFDQRHYRDAAATFQVQLDQSEKLLATSPGNRDYQSQLLNALAWLADARERNGELDEALAHRERQIGLLARMWAATPGDSNLKRNELAARRSLTRLYASRGQMREAFDQIALNNGVLAYLTKIEPNNTEWVQTGAGMRLEQAELQLSVGRIAEARQSGQAGCTAAAQLVQRDQSVDLWRIELQRRCTVFRAKLALKTNDTPAALAEARRLLAFSRADGNPVSRAMSTAHANMMLGEALAASGQKEAARGAYQTAATIWPKNIEEVPSELARKARLLDLTGQDSTPIRNRLAAIGYRHPDYMHRGR